MKKKFISVLLVLAMLIPLVACTPNTTAYLDACNKINSWKGSKVLAKGEYNFEIVNPEDGKTLKFKLPFAIDGISEGQSKAKLSVYADLKDLKDQAAKLGESDEQIKDIKDNLAFDLYVDNSRVILPKNFVKNINPAGKFDIKEDYFELPTSTEQNPETIKYFSSEEFKADILDLYKTALPDFKPAKDITISGNTYSYEATIDDILDDTLKATDSAIKNWDKIAEKLMLILKKANMPNEVINKDELNKFKESYNKEDFEKLIAEIKNTLKGSKISEKITFEGDQVRQNISITVNAEKVFKFTLNMSSVTTKDESIKVDIPTNVKKLTNEEFLKLMGQENPSSIVLLRVNGKTYDKENCQPKIINNRTMIPCRSLFEDLGAKVSYDEAAKEVTLKSAEKEIKIIIGKDAGLINGKEVKLDSPAVIVENKTYLPVRFISEALGYKVKYEKQGIVSLVDLYNVSDEELGSLIEKEEAKALEELKKSMDEKKSQSKEEKKPADEKIEASAKAASEMLFSIIK